MKKILFAALVFSLNAKAQTIDTTKVKGYSVVELVTPFQIKWNDTTKARYISVISASDNLTNSATFTYSFHAANGTRLDGGMVECKGADYASWSGDNKFPFQFVASKLGLPIK